MHPRNTKETPRKKSKLEIIKLHPKYKLQEKTKNKFQFHHQRNPALFLTFAYLFTPLLFVAPIIKAEPQSSVVSQPEGSLLVDLLTGMGGPEEVPVRSVEPLEVIKNEFEGSSSRLDNFFSPTEQTSFVTITRIYNHLKVANTVMPTTSSEITSDYGWRTPPCRGCSADHKGVDFVPGAGSPIFAVADGMVTEMGRGGGYGYYVKLKHLIGNSEGVIEEWETLYAHMKKDSFPEGMMIGSVVKSGDIIGAVGNTGMSTGPHLHFELIINGEHVDPLPLLGTYEVIIVSEEDYPDYMFVGQTIRRVETEVRYE
jgi:murein DD-endopeptidase MepM/ murein hydrolase activator NlpD